MFPLISDTFAPHWRFYKMCHVHVTCFMTWLSYWEVAVVEWRVKRNMQMSVTTVWDLQVWNQQMFLKWDNFQFLGNKTGCIWPGSSSITSEFNDDKHLLVCQLVVCRSAAAGGVHPSEEQLKTNYVTTMHEGCPNPKAPPNAAHRCSVFSLFLEDAPLQSVVASHIPRFFT